MKKMIKVSIIAVFLLIVCVGCQGDVTRALRHEGYSLGAKKIECEELFGKESTQSIRFLLGSHAVTTSGELYELSPEKKFSNNQNCRKANTNIKVSAVYDNSVVLGGDGKIYTLGSSEQAAYSEISSSNKSYEQYRLLFSTGARKLVSVSGENENKIYGLKDDGNVYVFTLNKADRNTPLQIAGMAIVYNKIDYGNIIDFDYAGESIATYVRTNDKYYHYTVTNSKECTKYADIQCSYMMDEDETLEKYSEYLIAYNGSSIYTSYNKYFKLGK